MYHIYAITRCFIPAKTFPNELTFTKMTYKPEMDDKNSEEFQKTANKILVMVGAWRCL